MAKTVPSIGELRSRYVLPAGIDLETIVRARWSSNNHAPNGTDELLAWLLILIDMHKAVLAQRAPAAAPTEGG